MITAILLVAFALALTLLPLWAGADTRDGRDWQPRSQWEGGGGASRH
jgi:hypothetical protein